MEDIQHQSKLTAAIVIKTLNRAADPQRAQKSQSFFKTEPGGYGEGDVFIGVTMPGIRKAAKQYMALDISEIQKLLDSEIHEHRMCGLLILTYQFPKANSNIQKRIYDFYLKNISAINNWDLVDVTAPNIVGQYLLDKPAQRQLLYDFAQSTDLWQKRIAMLSCFAFTRNNDFDDTLAIATILIHDEHDLIHKAVGWMLREVGKRDLPIEETFLKKYSHTMPRTMLRYAIERFEEKKRQQYLSGTVSS